MTRADFDLFTMEMGKLSTLYDKPLSEGLQALYFEALEPYPVQEIIRAMRQHIRSPEHGRFFPKPADLILLLDGDSESHAMQAWDTLTRTWFAVGAYGSVCFADPVITAAVLGMGGWLDFCEKYKKIKDEPFLRAEFCKRYLIARSRAGRDARLVLPGLCEADNRQRGYFEAIPAPVMIGESKEPRAIETTLPAEQEFVQG